MYLSLLMNSPYAIQQKAVLGTGDIIVHISCEKLASILIPLPPLAEQGQIVSRIEELTEKVATL
jgi:type I restriction enzyme S subunit